MLNRTRFRTWTPQSSWAMALLLIPVLAQCGGQTELVAVQQSSGGSSGSTGGSTGISVTSGTGGSMTLPLDAGPSCSMSASQYDNTCNVDSDCVEVPGGNPCSASTCHCPTTLNVDVATKYINDYTALSANVAGTLGVCPCTCLSGPCCRQGVCNNSCGMCSTSN